MYFRGARCRHIVRTLLKPSLVMSRSRHSPRHCPVSADAIASQLVGNGRSEAVDRKSSRLVSQEASEL